MYKIYGLITHKDDEIKYVGLTSKKLEYRLKQHIKSSLKKKVKYTKKENWIRKRINEGFSINIIELESNLSKEEANLFEMAWISYYGLENLTNLTIGGDGVRGKFYNYEERINWYNAINVYQYDLNGNFIKSYPTITECAKELNISISSVGYCILDKNLTSHGFIFVKDKNMLKEKLNKISNNTYKLYDLYGNLVYCDRSISNINKKYNLTQRVSEFSKKLNNGVTPKTISEKYFIKYPNFNLNIMLSALNRYKIFNLTTSEIKYFIKIEDISKYLKCSKSLIIDCLSGLRKSAKGYQIYKINDKIIEYSNKNYRKIIEIDDYGNCIKTFDNIQACANFYTLDPSCISKVCRGKRLHIKHHKFKYIDDIV